METRLPALATPGHAFDPRALAPGAKAVWLEIGFGGGEHLAAQAARHPDILFIGVEPFENGVASAVRHIDEAGLGNVRLHKGDARDLMRWLPPACLDRVFILFPDPWPKARHNKRRLVGQDFLRELAALMKPGARLRFATDWADYADQVLVLTARSPDFYWTAEVADDWRVAPADHIPTRYQGKRLGDCAPIWLEFERV
jgi:tRNA (guanine-N7-)-methyltransferase